MWVPSSSHWLCIVITLILGTLTTESEGKEAEACHVDPNLRVVELKCDTGHINIGSIQVGYAHGSCASLNCEYHLVGAEDGAEYLSYLHNLCNNEQDCTLSSEYLLSNISQRRPTRVFSVCWNSAQHLRNKVKLNYTCSVLPLTTTEAGPAGNTDDARLTSTTTNSPTTSHQSNASHQTTDSTGTHLIGDDPIILVAILVPISVILAGIAISVGIILGKRQKAAKPQQRVSLPEPPTESSEYYTTPSLGTPQTVGTSFGAPDQTQSNNRSQYETLDLVDRNRGREYMLPTTTLPAQHDDKSYEELNLSGRESNEGHEYASVSAAEEQAYTNLNRRLE